MMILIKFRNSGRVCLLIIIILFSFFEMRVSNSRLVRSKNTTQTIKAKDWIREKIMLRYNSGGDSIRVALAKPSNRMLL